MKIAVVVNELNVRGGTHKQVLRFCQYLKKKKLDFTLFTKIYDESKTYKEFKEIEIVSLYHSEIEWERAEHKNDNKKLFKCIPSDVDIVNVHDNQLNGLALRALMHGKKFVWQINDLPYVFNVGVNSNYKNNIRDLMSKQVIRYIAKRSNAITVNVTKNRIRVEEEMGISAKVLYCGVDVNPNLKRHFYKDFSSSFSLLTMGVFSYYRNYETLIKVISHLRSEGINITLDIIGSTETDSVYAQKINEMINDLKLDNYIKVWGQVSDEKYNELFNMANAF